MRVTLRWGPRDGEVVEVAPEQQVVTYPARWDYGEPMRHAYVRTAPDTFAYEGLMPLKELPR